MQKKVTPVVHHEGIVQKNSGDFVTVNISSVSACSSCHAKGSCNVSESEAKIIEVNGNYDVRPGDPVTILMKQSMGYSALFLGYILPFFLIIASLIILSSIEFAELTAGLFSLAMLVPYYTILFLFRKQINKKFDFTLKV
jgi:sigma-E factor negative regulatory protein RseC